MKKIVIAPDSFKGTLSSIEVCDIIECAVKRIFPKIEVKKMPIADGGEGTVDAFLAAKDGSKICTKVKDPLMRETEVYYGILDDGTAVIEIAQASGLPLVEGELDAMRATSYGTGELIRDALEKGCKRIVLGIGGSATTDGGAGAMNALGVRFLDDNGGDIPLGGGGLAKLKRIDASGVDARLRDIELLIACDVNNVLCGQNGAAAVYGPQKGATPDQVKILDDNLVRLAGALKALSGTDYASIAGTGAAGGLGVSLMALAGAKITGGIELVIETIDLEEAIMGAELVLTGEGKMDGQSLMGKVPVGVARVAKQQGIPVVAVVGSTKIDAARAREAGIDVVFPTVRDTVPFEIARKTCREDLADTVENIMNLKKLMKNKN